MSYPHQSGCLRRLELGSLVLEINGDTLDAKFLKPKATSPYYAESDTFRITKEPLLPPPGLVATKDTYISQAYADRNFGNLSTLRLDGDDETNTGADLRALLQWDVSANRIVTSAIISVNITNSTSGTYQVYEITVHSTRAVTSLGRPPSRDGYSRRDGLSRSR